MTRDRNWAAIGSTTFHVLCILALVFALKSCGSGLGNGIGNGVGDGLMELSIADLGDFEQGLGESQAAAQAETQPMPEPESNEVISEETSPVTAPKTDNKPKNTNPTKPTDKPKDPEKVSDGLSGALGNLGKGEGDGNTSGTGDEGNPEGQEGGVGTWGGNGGGGGWNLSGREIKVSPKLDENPEEAGKVVLDIYVDKNGNVVSTKRNYNKSNTTSDYLFKLAETAAKKAKFSVKSDAPPQQKGEMTFNFKLQ